MKVLKLIAAVALLSVFSTQAAFATTKQNLQLNTARIIQLAEANADGHNNDRIDDAISSLSQEEKVAILNQMKLNVAEIKAKLNSETEALQRSKNLHLTSSIAKFVATSSAVVGVTSVVCDFFSYSDDLKLRVREINLLMKSGIKVPERKLSKIKRFVKLRNGKFVLSYTQAAEDIIRFRMPTRIIPLGIVTALAFGVSVVAEIYAENMQVSDGDRELALDREKRQAELDFESLNTVMDSLEGQIDLAIYKVRHSHS